MSLKPGEIDSLLQEERVFRPRPKLVLDANVNPADLASQLELAKNDHLEYWERAALELSWFKKWDKVLDDSKAPFYTWFPGAKTNIVHNALDRHIHTVNKNKLALIWEGEPGDIRKFTYFDLYKAVNRFAGALRSLGVGKGDHVLIFMPLLPETLIAMLATAKIGAVHVLIFTGYSPKVLRDRIRDVSAKCVITADGFYRNGRLVNMKNRVDEALADGSCDSLDMVIVVRRAGAEVEMAAARDVWYEDLVRREKSEAPTEVMDADDPLFVLYTSGTGGEPRGIVHTHGGYMVGVNRALTTVFDIKPTDIYWCTADAGWITGHSAVVYGPLIAGTTTVMYEGHPLYPQADRIWHVVEKHGVSILYMTPTLIRMVKRYGRHFPRQRDITSLRLLGSVGEHIDPDTWVWLYQNIGREECPVLDTWWQTETGQFMISPLPISPLKPGSVNKPLPGIEADIVDENGDSMPSGKGGYLVIKKPWPAMFKNILGNPDRYRASFNRIPGCYWAGDVAKKDEDGFFWIQGRADEVLNISGHRLGTAEIESALNSHRAVNEVAVIGVPDKIKGEVGKAFVVLADMIDPSDELAAELKNHVRKELGAIALLKTIEFRDELPKTNTGKIMRRILRAEELGQDPGDTSTLELD